MKVKVTVKTPRKQAAACIKSQKKAFLGLGGAKKIIDEKVVSDSEFYWILKVEPKDMKALTTNAARGENIIRKFYRMLFKTIGRCNALQKKFKKGAVWIKKQLVKRFRKLTESSPDDNTEFLASIENMSDEEFGDFIVINDKEAMEKLLAGDLITIKELDDETVSE